MALVVLLVVFGAVSLDRILSWTTEDRRSWFPYGEYLSSTVLVFGGVTFIGLLCLRIFRPAARAVVLLAAAGAVLLELSQSVDNDARSTADEADLLLTVFFAIPAVLVVWFVSRQPPASG